MSNPDNPGNNIYRCTPRQVRAMAIDAIEAGLVPFVRGSPGVGKSSIFRNIANQFNVEMIDHRVSTSAPEDFTGLPEFLAREDGTRIARFSPFGDLFPIKGTPIPDGKDGWLLFLDEFNSGTKMVQAAAYKLILDKMTGQYPLHERVAIALAGNLETDRAITTTLSTAMQSRVIHIEMQVSHQEWLEDVALKEHYDERIIAFLGFAEKYLMDFRPDHDEKTFCCPRTWEFMNKLIKGKEVTQEKTALYAGTITSGVAAEFVAFCQLKDELVTIKDVLRDPENAPIPEGHNAAQRKWIIVTHLMTQANEENLHDLSTYINRMDMAFRVLFFRGLMVQQPKLRTHPKFAVAMQTLTKYLSGN
ncbi:MAG: putative sliding-clamp-loader subunit [Prokaryotic dsDNA virus sp.]|nr:MAG: putative sliding-clamp-loader subunit [Prokaryotic dsDNA virus sp.]